MEPQVSAEPDPAAGAAQTPAEEHVLIQQWGFEVIVRVVPLGWHDSDTTAPEKRRTSLETANIYFNPLYTSEDTSASSVSDDGGEHQESVQQYPQEKFYTDGRCLGVCDSNALVVSTGPVYVQRELYPSGIVLYWLSPCGRSAFRPSRVA